MQVGIYTRVSSITLFKLSPIKVANQLNANQSDAIFTVFTL